VETQQAVNMKTPDRTAPHGRTAPNGRTPVPPPLGRTQLASRPAAPVAVHAAFRLTSGNASLEYAARLANRPRDIRAAQALRFMVFNLELQEGLDDSFDTLLDADAFDDACDHLVAEQANTGEVVGTYRLQTGPNAAARCGYYSAREFELAPYEPLRAQVLELGRACVARPHRNRAVLQLLWRAVGLYARAHRARYLIGCSSVHSQDPRVGASLYSLLLRNHLAPLPLQTGPLPALACPLDTLAAEKPEVPRLLSAYLALGAKIAGPPALDPQFKTIDFLTILDLESLPVRAAEQYLR
jgi:putative hemolysin